MFLNLLDGQTVKSYEPIEGAERSDFIDGESITSEMQYIDGEPSIVEDLYKKRLEKIQEFVSVHDIENFDWEGVELSVDQYSDLITARDFENDKGSQVAILTKAIFKVIAMFIASGADKNVVATLFSQEIAMARKVSDTRVALGLSPFDLSFLD